MITNPVVQQRFPPQASGSLDPRERALTPAEHQPATVQPVAVRGLERLVGDAFVVHVRTALGDNAEAWQRFTTSPASYAGPTAWLRLGDLLDAAVNGTPWPIPPHK